MLVVRLLPETVTSNIENKKMELKDLIGEHELSGLDTFTKKGSDYYQSDADGYRFILDDITYSVVENPDDGYRSHLSDLEVTTDKVDYTFPPQKVFGKMREDQEYSKNDVLELYDITTNKLVLAIGTDNYDDWYPTCIMDWQPQNLAINIGR